MDSAEPAPDRLLASLLPRIPERFPLFDGTITGQLLQSHGDEDLNAVVTTQSDRYLLKAFPRSDLVGATRYVANHVALSAVADRDGHRLRIPRPIADGDGGVLQAETGSDAPLCWYLMEFVDGVNLADTSVGDEDRFQVIDQMNWIHGVVADIAPQTDSWSPLSLPSMLTARDGLMSDQERSIARSLEGRMRELAGRNLTIGTIHGSLEPSNLIRRRDASITVVDFGTVTLAPIVVDIAIFLVSCCINDARHPDLVVTRYEQCLTGYLELGTLSDGDLAAVPEVLEAAHWSYLLAARAAWDAGDKRPSIASWIHVTTDGISKVSESASEIRNSTRRIMEATTHGA